MVSHVFPFAAPFSNTVNTMEGNQNNGEGRKFAYPISTLPEHLHSTFPSHAKLPENTLTEKKNIPFPSLTLITCLTGPPVTPPPLHWETQPHPLIHNHSVLSAQGERSFP